MPLHPQLNALLKKFAELPVTDFNQFTARQLRELAQMNHFMWGAPPAIARVRDITIELPTHEIPLRIYQHATQKRPTLIYFHGGGHVLGNLATHDTICRHLCLEANVHVIAVDYRLAPENPYPACHEDAYSALRWIIENGHSFNMDVNSIILAGDSAGGNIAALLALRARDENIEKIKLQVLLYPELNLTCQTPSHQHYAQGFYLTKEKIEWLFKQYLPPHVKRDDPLVSPYFADLHQVAPAIIIAAEYDPLCDEAKDYAEKLTASQVNVLYTLETGMIHGFYGMLAICEQGLTSLKKAGRQIQQYLP
ncbi:MAG: alpha/beta hydrolase [Legionellales bacterium]|nr:alpha/beta hydrolase [Legionellales bacterium]